MAVSGGLGSRLAKCFTIGLWALTTLVALGPIQSSLAAPESTAPASTATTVRGWNLVGFDVHGAVTLELAPDKTQCPLAEPWRQAVQVPGRVTAQAVERATVGCATWTLTCVGDFFCSADLAINEPGEAPLTVAPLAVAPLAVGIYQAVSVKGRVTVPRTVDLPEHVKVSGRVRPGKQKALDEPELEFTASATLDAEGRIVFKIPTGAVDLRIAAEALAPAYRWNMRPVDATIDLGRLELVPGGSLLGYVIARETEFPVPGVTITALPAGVEGAPIADQEASHNTRAPSARSNNRGSFQLTALAPGAYRLRAEHPDYLAVEPAEIRVVRNAETILGGDIVLSPPLRLSVTIDPPTSPSGHPWQVALESLATSLETDTTNSNEDGVAVFEHLAPTPLRVRVRAEDAIGVFETTLDLAMDHELTVEIPIVEILGHVTLADEPVTGEIKIGTGNSDLWTASLDSEGRFTTWVRKPKLEVLFLAVVSEAFSSPAEVIVENAVVEDGKIELDVELLDLEISGVVTNRRGAPIRDALVIAWERSRIVAKVYSDHDGTFSMRPLQAGELRLKASRKGFGDSREQLLTLSEATPTIQTEFVIHPNRWFEGTVTGPSGEPIVGARLITFTVDQDLVSDTVATDLRGHFRAEVAVDSQQAVVLVAAAGYPFWSACIDSQQPASIQLAVHGGHLELRIDEGNEESDPPIRLFTGSPLFVNEMGGMVPLNEVWAWARRHGVESTIDDEIGSGYRFPNVSPGKWAAVWRTAGLAENVMQSCSLALGQGSEWVTVNPGDTSYLVLERNP